MHGSHSAGSFGTGHTDGLWRAMEQLRGSFDPRMGGPRKARGDVRAAVLVLLAEEPMHGYQIIREIESRSGGVWKPSAGSVYPTLQLFADEGLVSVEESGGRKVYALTDAGREEAERADVPWDDAAAGDGGRIPALAKAGIDLAGAVGQVARTGTPEQAERVVTVLSDARKRVYAILAED
ncbi:PadR family transcriptional regulator [Microbacterium halotolerans]|uniref:PadR family transcriptional regulator n=1 Tax=Microbacterium halotolerans TaxID=246613 RepID=UPI0013C2E8B6|nr:PadR family transcriptional regulator [Microbacterium halotolerans]